MIMNDFKKYATKHLGMNSLVLDDVIKSQAGYLNPYILEERQLNVTQLDVFSRLMMDRIIFLGTEINDYTANTLQAQLLYLDSVDNTKDISIYINSPGGSGAFFVAYLLGASDVNPLEPHYYCPVCRKVEWVDTVSDGWDLLPRACSCGGTMRGEGHRIPFETYRHVVQRNTSFDISVTPRFFPFAKKFAADYFKDCTLQTETRGIDGTETLTVAAMLLRSQTALP